MPRKRYLDEMAERLELTRRALGYDGQTEFCDAVSTHFSLTPQRWNNYERGRERITVDVAMALCDRFGLTMDWIYRNQRQGLPADIAKALEQYEIMEMRRRRLRDRI